MVFSSKGVNPLFFRVWQLAAYSSSLGSMITREGASSALEYKSIMGKTKLSPLPLLGAPIIKLLTGPSSI